MKVLYLVSRLRAGGPSNQLKNIVQNLEAQWKPSVLTLSPEEGATALPEFEQAGVPVRSLKLSRYVGFLRAPLRLRQIFREVKPDVVHSQGIRSDLLSALVLQDVFRVATLRNYPFDDYRSKFGVVQGEMMARAHLAALRYIEVPVACSQAVQRKNARHDLSLGVVQNGVDASTYCPPESAEKREALRRALDLPTDLPIFVSVGLLIPRKDPQRVIRGFQQSEAAEDGVLVMLGDGPLLDDCKEVAAEQSGEVKFPGFVDNVDAYLQAADCFISASLSEGLPNTVMEALGTGVPVILSDIPSHREILAEGSRAGRLFETKNTNELATSINSLRRQCKPDLRRTARKVVVSHFNATRVSEDYQKIYQSAFQSG